MLAGAANRQRGIQQFGHGIVLGTDGLIVDGFGCNTTSRRARSYTGTAQRRQSQSHHCGRVAD